MNITERRRKEGGFTLVEVLAAVTIIGFLAGVVLFSTASSRREAVWKSCQQEAASLDVAVSAYVGRNGYAPADDGGFAWNLNHTGTIQNLPQYTLVSRYLRSMPNKTLAGPYRVLYDRAGMSDNASNADFYQIVGRINTGNHNQYVCFLSGSGLETVVWAAGQTVGVAGPQPFPG